MSLCKHGGEISHCYQPLIHEPMSAPRDTDLAALRKALREPIIRAVARLDGYEHPNTKAGDWWDVRCEPVLAAVLGVIASAAPRAAAAAPALDVEPETIARWFHEAYERLAPQHGYETRKASAVPWENVPDNNRALMTATAREVLARLAAAGEPK